MEAFRQEHRERDMIGAGSKRILCQDLLMVAGWAVGLRVMFALLTSGTFDPDEFVLLALSSRYAHGAMPYRDFMFFHPPGASVLYRALPPLLTVWWPTARVASLVVDSATAVLVWRIGLSVYGRRGALAAGLIYGASPIALVTGVRVAQNSLITFLGIAGLAALVVFRANWSAALAGACLGAAIWIKYPALIFLPVYILAAPRKAPVSVLSALATLALLFAPFASDAHALWYQRVVWQWTRSPMKLTIRLAHGLFFWLGLSPLAVVGLVAGVLSARGVNVGPVGQADGTEMPGNQYTSPR